MAAWPTVYLARELKHDRHVALKVHVSGSLPIAANLADPAARLQGALAHRYRIEREFGTGGMATVYLADDLKHHRQVALKMHPHILTVLDSGEAAGRLWFTMPCVEGESLRERLLREKQLPVEDAVRSPAMTGAGTECYKEFTSRERAL